MPAYDPVDEDEDGYSPDSHRCTDVPCCILFVLSILMLLCLYALGVKNGDLRKLTRGIDTNGQICGVSPAVADKPLLFFCANGLFSSGTIATAHVSSEAACVAQCPVQVGAGQFSGCSVTQAYPSEPFMNRYCMPEGIMTDAQEEVRSQALTSWEDVAELVYEVLYNWRLIVMVFVASVILGYVYLFLLAAFAPCIWWGSLCIIMAAFAGAGAYGWMHQDNIALEIGVDVSMVQAVCALCAICAILVVVLGLCCAGNVAISIACVKAGIQIMRKNPLMLFSPVVKSLVKVVLALFLFAGFCYIWSTGDLSGSSFRRRFDFPPEVQGCIFFYIFVSVWIMEFVSALDQFSVAFVTVEYYFTPEVNGERNTGRCNVCQGACYGLGKHCGSLALGSMIVAIFQVFAWLMDYLQRVNEENDDNALVACVLRCLECVCYCCSEVFRYINKMAYIDIAVSGHNFCTAIRSVAHMMIDYGTAALMLNGATFIFQVVGTALIVVSCGFLAELMLYEDEIVINMTLIVCILVAYVVAYSFMAVFDTTTDTLLYCFAVDKNETKGEGTTAPKEMLHLFSKAEKECQKKKEQKKEEDDREQQKKDLAAQEGRVKTAMKALAGEEEDEKGH